MLMLIGHHSGNSWVYAQSALNWTESERGTISSALQEGRQVVVMGGRTGPVWVGAWVPGSA